MKSNDRKAKIINAAYQLFTTRGYSATSVDEVIADVNIAKGTFYYYFETKEELLEEVINKILGQEKTRALEVAKSSLPTEQRLVGAIIAMRPEPGEEAIADALNKPENVIMHEKINRKIVEIATPILAEIVKDGIAEGLFDCDNIEERIKLLLIMSSEMFDSGGYTKNGVEVFIDTVEKILGAKNGSMQFIKKLISKEA